MFRLRVAAGIELRQMEEIHAQELFALTERNRSYLRQWLPWVDQAHSSEDTRRYIVGAVSQYQSNRGPNAAIWIGQAIARSIGCHPIDWTNRACSIGYWLDAGYQGQGIMTQCCTALIDYLFDETKLHRVVIQCGVGNTRSCAIPQRLGFTREGVAREAEWVNDRWVDLVVWGMLAQDWKSYRRGTKTPRNT